MIVPLTERVPEIDPAATTPLATSARFPLGSGEPIVPVTFAPSINVPPLLSAAIQVMVESVALVTMPATEILWTSVAGRVPFTVMASATLAPGRQAARTAGTVAVPPPQLQLCTVSATSVRAMKREGI